MELVVETTVVLIAVQIVALYVASIVLEVVVIHHFKQIQILEEQLTLLKLAIINKAKINSFKVL